MTDNRPATWLQTSILNKELQGKSKIPVYTPTTFVTSGMATQTLNYNKTEIKNLSKLFKQN